MVDKIEVFNEAVRLFCEDLTSYLDADQPPITPDFGGPETDHYWYDFDVHCFEPEAGVMSFTLFSNDDGGPSILTVFFDSEDGEIRAIVQDFDTYLRAIDYDDASPFSVTKPNAGGN